MGFFEGVKSLVNDAINKFKPDEDETREGVLDVLEEMDLKLEDDELIKLKNQWTRKWESYEPSVLEIQKENENYWKGIHYNTTREDFGLEATDRNRPMVDNLIFESLETFLPMATKQNPEPVVVGDNSEPGEKLAKKVQAFLAYQADRLRLKLRLKRVVRYWALYTLGVAKIAWSEKKDDITLTIIRPQKLILDPDATINDDMEYTGEYLGEYRSDTAKNLIERFPKKKDEIIEEVKGKLGSKVSYIEWWTNDYVFWSYKDNVLAKAPNPHWNEDDQQPILDQFGNPALNEDGTPKVKVFAGRNHFEIKKMPYIFLSIYNLGKHPHDDTSLISQNLANQDIVNKRQKQIDRNVDGMNGGWVVSGDSGLTKEQATEFIKGARAGKGLWIGSGNPNNVVARLVGSSLPGDVFNNLADIRNELRDIFGVRGSTAAGTASENTVRGKIIVRTQDTDRIGGGISEYLEQFADQVYNWFVQMMMVYYDDRKSVSIIGQEKTREFIDLAKQDFTMNLTVSVKEGSLIPKDSLTQANQAVDLAQMGKISDITLFDRLGFPNPKEEAIKLFKQATAPQLLYPEVAQEVQQAQTQQAMEQAATQQTIQGSMAQMQAQQPESGLPPIQ